MFKKSKAFTLSFHPSITHHSKRGFTLIELLVVMFIIALLATMVVINVSSSRVTARDTKRKADLKTIQNAIEMYANKTGSYPKSSGAADCWNMTCNWIPNTWGIAGWEEIEQCGGAKYPTRGFDWSSPYISGIQPRDPVDNCCWPYGNCGSAGVAGTYEYWSNGDRYLLAARLEDTNDSERNEITKVHAPYDDAVGYETRSYADYWSAEYSHTLGKYVYVLAN